jgi:processive 1,2-diacylglycerol beta-glucosyltransferase
LYCVVTDLLDIHKSWVADAVTRYFAATECAADALRQQGARGQDIEVSGIPLRQPFWSASNPLDHLWRPSTPNSTLGSFHGTLSVGEARIQQSDGRLRVLAMDGGMPGPRLRKVVETLLDAGPTLDVVVGWGRYGPAHRELVLAPAHHGLVRHLAEGEPIAPAMRRADLVVTKAGSVTLAESLALGKAVLVHRVAPGQERSNPTLLTQAGAGLHVPTLRRLADAVRWLSEHPADLQEMSLRAAVLGRPDAALDVAARILDMLGLQQDHPTRAAV